MGVGECVLTTSLSLAVWECKILTFDGRSHKVWSCSHISSTRWCSVQPKGVVRRVGGSGAGCKGRWHASYPPSLIPPHVPPPLAWGVWGWVGARALDASLWTLCSGRGHLACLHNGIISVPAMATAAVSTSCPSASTSCPWRTSTNCPPSKQVLKHAVAAGRQSRWRNVCGMVSLGIAQCVCWLLCTELHDRSFRLKHNYGRRLYVSTLR